MADGSQDRLLLTEVHDGAEAMARLGQNDETFRAVVDAFRAQDGESMERLLARHDLAARCEVVCHWLRSKECVLLCLELAGPPRLEQEPPNIREFATTVAKVTADEELVELIAAAVEQRDADSWAALVSRRGLEPFSHLLCHWVCTVYYRLVCVVVCQPVRVRRPPLIPELRAAGHAIGELAADEKAFAAAVDAVTSNDVDRLGAVLAEPRFGPCRFICEWFCSWRCLLVCLGQCRVFPIELPESPVEEMLEFAKATGRLAGEPGVLERLAGAALRDDGSYERLVEELKFERFCIQFCHWVCFLRCVHFCILVCPPPALNPLFTRVGAFNISPAGISPATGKTAVALPAGGKDFAFYSDLELGGFCPATSPAVAGAPMSYRFLHDNGSGPVPIATSAYLAGNSREISWPDHDAAFLTVSTSSLQNQSIVIVAPTPAPPFPDNTPPNVGDPWYAPGIFYIAPDVDGWVQVDPDALGGGFQQLLGFDTTAVVPGGSPLPPGSTAATVAGNPAPNFPNPPGTALPGGTDLGIIFQATRTSTVPAVNAMTSPPDFTNELPKIRINNWLEVNELWFVEFGTDCCTPITTTLGVEYTVDHEEIDAGTWSLQITSCSPSAPGDITPAAAATTASAPPQPFPTGTLDVASTAGFPMSGELEVAGVAGLVSYTGITATAFTGCTGGTGTSAAGGAVTQRSRGGSGTILENTSAWGPCSYMATLTTTPGLTTGLLPRPASPNSLTFCICTH